MARIPLAANLQSRDGTVNKDSLITNGFVESLGEAVQVYKRPGITQISDIGDGYGGGITSFTNSETGDEVLYGVQGGQAKLAASPTPGTSWDVNDTSPDIPTGNNDHLGGLISYGGYIWMIGGLSLPAASYRNDVWYKSVATGGSWTSATSSAFASGRIPIALGALGKMWIFGGESGSGDTNDVYSSVNGSTWTLVQASPPWANCRMGRFVEFNNLIWHLGSGTGDATWTAVIYSSADGVTWSTVQAAPAFNATPRQGYAVCVFAGKMWVIGGRLTGAGTFLNDVWSSADGITWTQETAAAAFTGRRYSLAIASGAVMTLVGGETSVGSGNADIWTSLDGITWTNTGTSNLPTAAWSDTYKTQRYHLVRHKRVFCATVNTASTGGWTFANTNIGGGGVLATIPIEAGEIADFAQNYLGTEIMFKVAAAAYRINTVTNAAAQITDPDYPNPTARGCVYLNGHYYVMDLDGTIYNSAEDDCTSWPGTDFITAEFEPDGGVCLAKYNQYIAAFGRYTTEFFFDAGNSPGSPLSPVETSVMLVGCAAAGSVAQIESSLIFMGQRKGSGQSFQKGRFIAMLEGFSFRIISIPDVDRILDQDDLNIVYSCVQSFSGHTFYILTLKSSAITLVFDLTAKMWYRWTRREAGTAISITSLTQSNGLATATVAAGHGLSDGDPVTISGASPAGYNGDFNITYVSSTVFTYPVSSALSSPATGTISGAVSTESYWDAVSSCNYEGKQVFQEEVGGVIFEIDEDVLEDAGQPIDFRVRTSKWDAGDNKAKFMGWLELIADKVSSTGLIRYTDDDYQTYSTYRRLDMSLQRSAIRRLGNFRRRAFEFRHTLDTRLKADALEFDLEKGY